MSSLNNDEPSTKRCRTGNPISTTSSEFGGCCGIDFNALNNPPSCSSTTSSEFGGCGSGIDFSALKNEVIVENGKTYGERAQSSQYVIKQTLKAKLNSLFDQHRITSVEECLEFLDYYRKSLGESIGGKQHDDDVVIQRQLKTLNLSERTSLIKMLTLADGIPNEDVLRIFPALRARSEELSKGKDRKTRKDKIDN